MSDLNALRLTCQRLYGDRWHTAMARELGARHPKKPRQLLAPSMIWKLDRGVKPVPAWIHNACISLVRDEIHANTETLALLEKTHTAS